MEAKLQGLDYEITYAGVDLKKIAHNATLTHGRNLRFYTISRTGQRIATPGAPYWEYGFTADRELPDSGKVELEVASGYAKGEARLEILEFQSSPFGHDTWQYRLIPDCQIIYPEQEAIEQATREREEKERQIEYDTGKAELKDRIVRFKSIPGHWAMTSNGFNIDDFDTLEEALEHAIVTVDWGDIGDITVTCDSVTIFDEDDLYTLLEMREKGE